MRKVRGAPHLHKIERLGAAGGLSATKGRKGRIVRPGRLRGTCRAEQAIPLPSLFTQAPSAGDDRVENDGVLKIVVSFARLPRNFPLIARQIGFFQRGMSLHCQIARSGPLAISPPSHFETACLRRSGTPTQVGNDLRCGLGDRRRKRRGSSAFQKSVVREDHRRKPTVTLRSSPQRRLYRSSLRTTPQ